MRILFTPEIFNMQRFGGISRYFVRLAEEIDALRHDVHIVAPFHVNDYLDHSSFGKYKHKRRKTTNLIRKTTRAANSLSLQYRLWFNRPDIVHSTYFRGAPPLFSTAKRVVTVFDFVDELYHQSDQYGSILAEQKRRAVEEADLVLCISQSTRQDLIRFLGDDKGKAVVTYLAADNPPSSALSSSHPLNGDPYLLYVGSRWKYKNFKPFVEAFSRSDMCRNSLKLVAYGSDHFADDEIEHIKMLGLSESQVTRRSGSDDDLYQFYRHAELFVYPSLYEGFGIPPLEAMSVGCPVACSNTSSIPEVVGDAAFIFDPTDIDAMRIQIDLALTNEQLRQDKIERGYKQFSKFSWHQCAIDTLNAYQHVLGAA